MNAQPQTPEASTVSFTLTKGASHLAKWCDRWNRKAAAAGVRATMRANCVGRPSVGKEAHQLILAVPGKPAVLQSFAGLALDDIKEPLLREVTTSMMAVGQLGTFEF